LSVRGSPVDGDQGAVVPSQIAGPSVSMALTERQEFAFVIQRGGGELEGLVKLLREKTGQPKVGLGSPLPSHRVILGVAPGSSPPAT
jgi:hypothetical protein